MMKRTPTFDRSSAALWASAFVIGALIIVQAGRLPANPAFASTASDRGDFSLLTLDSGVGGDTQPYELLYVIDSRQQAIMVYQIEDARRKQILLRDGGSLDQIFRLARP